MPAIIIPLSEPIKGHPDPMTGQGAVISEITLREPGFREIMRFGEPFSRGYSTDGAVIYTAENIDALRGYIEALVLAPANPLLLEQLNAKDTLRIKDALIVFFQNARPKPSAASSTSSSST